MKKVERQIGDIVVAEFIKNQNKGKKPICLIDGIVSFVNKSYRGQFIQEHSLWHVEIVQINERTMVIDPIQIVKSAAENQHDINARMKELAAKHSPIKTKRG
jgi:hypothetical protein